MEDKLIQLYQFLHPISAYYLTEVMNSYPDEHSTLPQIDHWVSLLECYGEEDWYQLEAKQDPSFLPHGELKTFLLNSLELGKVNDTYHQEFQLGHHSKFRIKEKKRHEIQVILSFIKELSEKRKIKHVYDWAGGMGHLARLISKELGFQTYSIDSDSIVQKKGLTRALKDKTENIAYIESDLTQKNASFASQFELEDLVLGLHTCGDLALTQIENFVDSPCTSFLNFPCCYHKTQRLNDLPLSQLGKRYKIPWSMAALTLAAKSYRLLSFADFKFKLRVKTYRYTFHLYLYEILGRKKVDTLGNSLPSIYDDDFHLYAEEQIKRINDLKHIRLDRNELNQFFVATKTQNRVRRMILSGMIRGYLGRPLELYLIYDRGIYLKEQNMDVAVKNFFNLNLSPRNLGIFAQKKGPTK